MNQQAPLPRLKQGNWGPVVELGYRNGATNVWIGTGFLALHEVWKGDPLFEHFVGLPYGALQGVKLNDTGKYELAGNSGGYLGLYLVTAEHVLTEIEKHSNEAVIRLNRTDLLPRIGPLVS